MSVLGLGRGERRGLGARAIGIVHQSGERAVAMAVGRTGAEIGFFDGVRGGEEIPHTGGDGEHEGTGSDHDERPEEDLGVVGAPLIGDNPGHGVAGGVQRRRYGGQATVGLYRAGQRMAARCWAARAGASGAHRGAGRGRGADAAPGGAGTTGGRSGATRTAGAGGGAPGCDARAGNRSAEY